MAGIGKKTKIEQQKMEQLVYDWLIMGWTAKNMVTELMTNYNYKTEFNCRKLIDKVNKSLIPTGEENIEEIKSRYIDMYLDIYSRAVDSSDWKAANAIMANLVKLRGLAIDKQEIKVEGTYQIEF